MTGFMARIQAPAGTLAVGRDGETPCSRGYGWQDEESKLPTRPDVMMRIAGITKAFTQAAVRKLIRDGKLTPDTKVFPLLEIASATGRFGDPRLADITVAHLLEHKAGWDRLSTFDPMFTYTAIGELLGLGRDPTPEELIGYMLTQPLQFTPGAKSVPSNFGYCVLGRVIERVAQVPYITYIKDEICAPAGIEGVELGATRFGIRGDEEVWYPIPNGSLNMEVRDSAGGLIASAPALCKFMEHYWLGSGEPRQGNGQQWYYWGDFMGTTSLVMQTADGTNLAALFNNRQLTFRADHAALREMIDDTLPR